MNNLINKYPLEIWQSPEVTKLLEDFFAANYKIVEVEESVSKGFVQKPWQEKNSKDWEVLRKECGAIFNKIKDSAEKIKHPENDPLDLIDFSNVKSFLDIGANKLSAINFIAKKNRHIEKFIGIDIVPQHTEFAFPEKSQYYQTDPEAKNFPVEQNSIDVILAQYAFHHFPDQGSIKRCLNSAYGALKPGGRFVLMEESFTENFNMSLVQENKLKHNIHTDHSLTERFYNLPTEKRWEFIVANDWLINVNNSHMPWTGQYRTWQGWQDLLEESGFAPDKTYNLGLRVNGRLKQGVHIVGVFNKIAK